MIWVVCAIIFITGLTVAFAIFFLQKPKQKPTPVIKSQPPLSRATSGKLPTAKFNSYAMPRTIPTPPSELYEYSVKSTFTDEEVKSVAKNFSLTNYTKEKDVAVVSDIQNPKSRGMLTFNTTTGMFSYQSFGGTVKFTGDKKEASKKFLASLGLNDDAIDCNITYQIEIIPNATYVECHRSWEKLGLPLVSAQGLYNLSETTRISQLKVGYVDADALDDTSIINVSTGQNGKIRPNDFNTATLLIDNNNNLVSIDSSLRFVTDKTQVTAKNYQDALLSFSDNKNVDSFILPAGGGYTNFSEVFPNNVAESRQAMVDDFEIVYLEKLNTVGMTNYTPVYLLRGTAQLTNGYTVKYVQSTPAVNTDNSLSETTQTLTSAAKPIQIGTFTPTTYPTLSPTTSSSPPQTPTTEPSMPPPVDTNYDCRAGGAPYAGGVEYNVTLPDGSTLVLGTSGPGAKHTLWVKQSTAQNSQINSLRDQFAKVVENEYIYIYNNHENFENFHRVSDYGGLAGFYQNNSFQAIGGNSYAPINKYYQSTSPRLKKFFESYEKRTMAIDKGAQDPGPTQDLHFEFIALTMIGLGEDGNKGGVYRCYLSGGSPSLFLYSNNPSQPYSISVTDHVTYADPALETTWLAFSNSEGKISVKGAHRNFLYYEFDKQQVGLSSGKEGYIIKRNNINNLSEQISNSLQLTNNEKLQLQNEFNNALKSLPVTSEYIKVTLVDSQMLSQKLPLAVIPQIPTYRYHFLVSESGNNERIRTPQLSPIQRTGSLLLEIGASTSQY